jgi:hypothetical protein
MVVRDMSHDDLVLLATIKLQIRFSGYCELRRRKQQPAVRLYRPIRGSRPSVLVIDLQSQHVRPESRGMLYS